MRADSEISGVLRDLINRYGLSKCVQCGKCSSACTMVETFDDFTYSWAPRTVIEDALSGRDILQSPRMWFCLTCDVCEYTCPSGVRFSDFIDALRGLAVRRGHSKHLARCRSCGAPLLPAHTLRFIHEKTHRHLPDSALLCKTCKRRIIVGKFKDSAGTSKRMGSEWRKNGRKRLGT